MRRRALKSIMGALVAPVFITATACAPPSASPERPIPTSGDAWVHPSVPPTCDTSALTRGDLVDCVLQYATASSQGFGTPPFPATTIAPTTGLAAIPPVALDAYRNAVARLRATDPTCGVGLEVVAAIGYNESRHAVNGARLGPGGKIAPPILGPPTSYANTLSPADRVRFQNTQPFIQAVGATQFLPSTWKAYEPDGNGDGVSDPFNIYDDALGTAMYLCRLSRMKTDADIRASIWSYGYRTPDMQNNLLSVAAAYRLSLAGTSGLSAAPISTTTASSSWLWNGGNYNGSPALAAWEGSMVRTASAIGPVKAGAIIGQPDVVPLFAGFLGDLVHGGYSIKEAYSYAYRCTSNSERRDCLGLTPDSLSLHAYGLAMDVNWSTNPERIYRGTATSSACAQAVATDIPEWVVAAAQRWGLFWAGYGWSGRCPGPSTSSTYVNRDPMHFEFRGTPELARRIVAWNTTHPRPAEAQPPA